MSIFKKIPMFVRVLISLIAFLLIVSIVFYVAHNHLQIVGNKKALEDSITYYILGIATSLLVILVAYVKIDEANKNSRLNYLLRIDERWASTEIIEAREVIHAFYLDIREVLPLHKPRKESRFMLGQKIRALHDEKNKKKIKEFIKLLNFLDFLETIGYLRSTDSITVIEIKELLGNSIVYYFEIFQLFIEFRREETGDKKFYEHFERLYEEIKASKN